MQKTREFLIIQISYYLLNSLGKYLKESNLTHTHNLKKLII